MNNNNMNQPYQQHGGYQQQTYQQAPMPQQPAMQAPYPMQQAGSGDVISGGTKALYGIIGFLFPLVAVIMVVVTGNPNSPGHVEGETREKLKWAAIGCAVCLVFSIIVSVISAVTA